MYATAKAFQMDAYDILVVEDIVNTFRKEIDHCISKDNLDGLTRGFKSTASFRVDRAIQELMDGPASVKYRLQFAPAKRNPEHVMRFILVGSPERELLRAAIWYLDLQTNG